MLHACGWYMCACVGEKGEGCGATIGVCERERGAVRGWGDKQMSGSHRGKRRHS